MMRIRRKIPAIIICLCMLMALFCPMVAMADSGAELIVNYGYSGVRFCAYRVANQNKQLTGGFAGYDLSLDCENNAQWQALAARLEEIVKKDKLTPTVEQRTGEDGNAKFSNLTGGWYLITGDQTRINGTMYQPVPFVADLMEGAQTKAEVKHSPVPEEPTEPTPEEPTEPTPEEPTEPTPENPTEPTPERPSEPTPENPTEPTPVEPTNPSPDNPSSDNPGNSGRPGSSGGSDRDPGPDNLISIIEQIIPLGPGDGGEEMELVEIPSEEVPLVSLPQTGQLWWPVPVLLAGGVMLILAGVFYQRKGKIKHEE